jgi:voltage-gated potassium channel
MTVQSDDPKEPMTSEQNEIAFESPYELFIISVSMMSLVVILLYLFVPLPSQVREILSAVDAGICVLFMIDFFRSLYRAPHKFHYLLHWGWLDFIGSLPLHPILRLLRIARVLIAARNLYQMPIRDVYREVRSQRAQSTLLIMLFLMFVVVTVSSSVVVMAEAGTPGANIETGEDSLWWAFVTVTTVGYGDFYPVTEVGRFFAGILMIVGVGLFTVLTSYIATTFLKPGHKNTVSAYPAGSVDPEQVAEIQSELAEIKKMLSEIQKE